MILPCQSTNFATCLRSDLDLLEFVDGVIRCQRSLLPFFACNTDANMCLLDHSDIVSTISNTEDSFTELFEL